MRVLATNITSPEGEIDLLMDDHGTRVVVEVRTVTGSGDPIDAVGRGKRERVSRLARRLRAGRVDFVGVAIRPDVLDIHWVPE